MATRQSPVLEDAEGRGHKHPKAQSWGCRVPCTAGCVKEGQGTSPAPRRAPPHAPPRALPAASPPSSGGAGSSPLRKLSSSGSFTTLLPSKTAPRQSPNNAPAKQPRNRAGPGRGRAGRRPGPEAGPAAAILPRTAPSSSGRQGAECPTAPPADTAPWRPGGPGCTPACSSIPPGIQLDLITADDNWGQALYCL